MGADLKSVQSELESFAGEEDKVWFRGDAGCAMFHIGYGKNSASIEMEMGRILLGLVEKHKPKVIVEVGSNIGYSTSWLLLGVAKNELGHITTFDIADPADGAYVWLKLDLPSDKVTTVRSSVWDGKDKLPDVIDFVFHDASHEVDQTKKELEVLTPRMSVGGVMAFHDSVLCGHLGEVCKKWFSNLSGWKYSEIREGRGLGLAERIS